MKCMDCPKHPSGLDMNFNPQIIQRTPTNLIDLNPTPPILILGFHVALCPLLLMERKFQALKCHWLFDLLFNPPTLP